MRFSVSVVCMFFANRVIFAPPVFRRAGPKRNAARSVDGVVFGVAKFGVRFLSGNVRLLPGNV